MLCLDVGITTALKSEYEQRLLSEFTLNNKTVILEAWDKKTKTIYTVTGGKVWNM